MRVTANDATLLTMRIATLDLILRSRRRRRLEGEVVHSATPALRGPMRVTGRLRRSGAASSAATAARESPLRRRSQRSAGPLAGFGLAAHGRRRRKESLAGARG